MIILRNLINLNTINELREVKSYKLTTMLMIKIIKKSYYNNNARSLSLKQFDQYNNNNQRLTQFDF